ncbi:putative EH domain-binding protein 1, partial [Triplophysa rosa]
DVVDGVSVEGEDEEGRSEKEAAAAFADDVTDTNHEEDISSSYLLEDDFTNSASDLASLGVMNSRHVDLKLKKLTEIRPQGCSSPSSSSSSSSLTASSNSPLSPESGGLQVSTSRDMCSIHLCLCLPLQHLTCCAPFAPQTSLVKKPKTKIS